MGNSTLRRLKQFIASLGSDSHLEAKEALSHLEGKFRDELLVIESSILEVLTHIEAAIDFSERDIVTESSSVYSQKIAKIFELIELEKNYFKRSKNLVSQKKIIMAGPPNVGKSSLFNCLINEDRALVSSVPGTTRDLVHQDLFLGSSSIKIQDTAGLRKTDDPVEMMGIEKTIDSISNSNLILWVNDSTKSFQAYLKS